MEAVRKMVKSGETSTTRRYYINSPGEKDAEKIAGAIRGHWGIENDLHWYLDIWRLTKTDTGQEAAMPQRIPD